MKPDISEFSYGYALIDELIHWYGTNLTAAPVFPSLYREGQLGGGYDVLLEEPGILLFLQFKLSDCMLGHNTREFINGLFGLPCYRMHLRPGKYSRQHEMLLDLEHTGEEVYYSAPAFHTIDELNDSYLHHHVRDKSLWIRPSDIGVLSDDNSHHVTFTIPGTHYVFSEPRQLETKGTFEVFTRRIEEKYSQKGEMLLRESLFDTIKALSSITDRRDLFRLNTLQPLKERLEPRRLLEITAFYAHVLLNSHLFVVTEKAL